MRPYNNTEFGSPICCRPFPDITTTCINSLWCLILPFCESLKKYIGHIHEHLLYGCTLCGIEVFVTTKSPCRPSKVLKCFFYCFAFKSTNFAQILKKIVQMCVLTSSTFRSTVTMITFIMYTQCLHFFSSSSFRAH